LSGSSGALPAAMLSTRLPAGSAPLDPDKFYRIAVNDFIARGGDGYASFAAVDPLLPFEDAPLLSDEVMVYLRDLGGNVQSRVEGRITAK